MLGWDIAEVLRPSYSLTMVLKEGVPQKCRDNEETWAMSPQMSLFSFVPTAEGEAGLVVHLLYEGSISKRLLCLSRCYIQPSTFDCAAKYHRVDKTVSK